MDMDMSLAIGTPKADGSDWTPGFDSGWTGLDQTGDMEAQMQAMQMSQMSYHADVASKNAVSVAQHGAQLAQWVQHLWQQNVALESKVKELEDWKKRTLDDMRKLREEHKQLRKRFGGGDEPRDAEGVKKVVSSASQSHADAETPLSVPPGLELPAAITSSSSTKDDDLAGYGSPMGNDLTDKPDLAEGKNEGVNVTDNEVEGESYQRAEWRIGHLSVKLRGCMGRALVSPPFTAWGMEDLRLMIYPDQKESATGPRSRRQKELYNKKVSDGPLDGCLKLKVPNCPAPHILDYYLTVGAVDSSRKGPFSHNFADCTVSDPAEFGMDWLQQVDADGGLIVSVDIKKMAKP